MCERWVGDWTECNILTPSTSDYSSTSFSFCWAAQPGVLRAKALCWELVLSASNCNSNTNCNWLQLTPTVCGTGLYHCLTSTCFLWYLIHVFINIFIQFIENININIKKLDGNYTRMLRAILNKSWRQHLTKHQRYGHLPPITKTIKVKWTRLAGHCIHTYIYIRIVGQLSLL